MKKELREIYLDKRKMMFKDEALFKSKIIYNKIINYKGYINCNELFIYVSNFNEVDTLNIIKKAFEDNKRVAVPKVQSKRVMRFYYINSIKDLKKGKFNILEPITLLEANPSIKSLFIMPGVVFDLDKNRIGFGGGYYDQYLSRCENPFEKIALCYDNQLMEHIPADDHDIKPDFIITESQII